MSKRRINSVEQMRVHLRARIRDLTHAAKGPKGAVLAKIRGALEEALALYDALGGDRPSSQPARFVDQGGQE